MSIQSDMLLVNSRTFVLSKDDEVVPTASVSHLVLAAAGKANGHFKLAPPYCLGHILMLQWDAQKEGKLLDGGTIRLSSAWAPKRHDTLMLFADGRVGWIEAARSNNGTKDPKEDKK